MGLFVYYKMPIHYKSTPLAREMYERDKIRGVSQDFSKQLVRQLGFLQRSCADYDEGHTDESVRIATIIRVLIHDTRNSTSLLKHLSALSINLSSTVEDIDRSRVVMQSSMGRLTGTSQRLDLESCNESRCDQDTTLRLGLVESNCLRDGKRTM
jgi:hypothetical protein